VSGCCEYGNELFGSVEFAEFCRQAKEMLAFQQEIWFVMLCVLVKTCKRFRGKCCLLLHGIRNVPYTI
jgi:hypothetical protein